jgi:anti-sigma regulatory factor (Ser/Thr protein kinase)
LTTWGCSDALDGAALLVTELVTNAVLHARTPVTVDIQFHDDVVRIEVGDESDRLPVAHRGPPDAMGGRGLAMVASHSRAWGVTPLPAGGKRVWFELDC